MTNPRWCGVSGRETAVDNVHIDELFQNLVLVAACSILRLVPRLENVVEDAVAQPHIEK